MLKIDIIRGSVGLYTIACFVILALAAVIVITGDIIVGLRCFRAQT